jgi:hypothetical protein
VKRLLPFLLPGLLLAQGPVREFTGVITDTMCGADHTHMGIRPDERCVRECVKSSKWKYALIDAKGKMMVLSDQQTPEKFANRSLPRACGPLRSRLRKRKRLRRSTHSEPRTGCRNSPEFRPE